MAKEDRIKKAASYVKENLEKGYTVEELRKILIGAGYSTSEVDKAIEIATKPAKLRGVPQLPVLEPKKVTAPAAPAAPAAAPAAAPGTPSAPAEEGLEWGTEKILAALSYPILIVAIILLVLAKKKNKFGKYHGFQALFWNIAYIVIYLILTLALFPLLFRGNLFAWAVGLAWGWLITLLTILLWLAFIVLSVIFAIQAYQEKRFKIPIIGNLVPAEVRAEAGVT